MKNSCVDISIYGERNYKLFLDIIKREIDKLKYTDITAIQALILLNLGDNVVTISEVISRGYYIGSNASYNVKKLVKSGYITQVSSNYDKRAVLLKLTPKATTLCAKIDKSIEAQMNGLEKTIKGKLDLKSGIEFLKTIERFWQNLLQTRI